MNNKVNLKTHTFRTFHLFNGETLFDSRKKIFMDGKIDQISLSTGIWGSTSVDSFTSSGDSDSS